MPVGREEFLNEARERFRESGMAGVNEMDIASEIGMDSETMQSHFPDRTSLVVAVLLEELGSVSKAAMKALPQSQLDLQLKHLLKARFGFYVQHKQSSALILREVIFSRAGWRETYENMLWRFSVEIVSLFHAAKRRGEIRQDVDEALAARALVSYYVTGVLMGVRGDAFDDEGVCAFVFPLVDCLVASLK
jgi:AcrR family transcriptional regulator